MKPYLFLSGCLLLGASISMPSLADTRVVDASCNDARYGACIPTPPLTTLLGAKDIQSSITNARVAYVSYSEAKSRKNEVVRWGGLITGIENEENHSLIRVRFHPLDESGRPQLDQPGEGKFVIKTPEFIDPVKYIFMHSEITVVGTLNCCVKRIDGNETSVPMIVLSDHEKYSYIWSISEEKYRNREADHFMLDLSDPKFFTTSDDRSLLEETLVIAGKTVVVTVVAAGYLAVFSMLGGGICCR